MMYPLTPKIIYEDKDVVVLNKPAGMLVHPVRLEVRSQRSEVEMTVVDWLRTRYPETQNVGDDPAARPGIVHRLDKDTSGVMVVARTEKAFKVLKAQFQSHTVQKTYLALVHGEVSPEKGIITEPIGLIPGSVKRTVHVKRAKMVKEAVTEYRVRKHFPRYTLLEVIPRTGRTHQIRVHFASRGHPVAGDALYGSQKNRAKKPLGLTRQFLHAYSITFTLPDGGRMKAVADLPKELARALAKAQGARADRSPQA